MQTAKDIGSAVLRLSNSRGGARGISLPAEELNFKINVLNFNALSGVVST